MKKVSIISTLTLCILQVSLAQYVQFDLHTKVNNSDFILEGKVIDQFTYEKNDLVYTASKIETCAVIYQGVTTLVENEASIYVITHGGQHNEKFNSWTHMLKLHEGMEGLFFLKSSSLLAPSQPPSNSQFFEVYGQEQGFIAYSKDDSWGFSGTALFEDITEIDEFIVQINSITNQTNITKSCILEQKSGVVLSIDSSYIDQDDIVFETSLKGQWGKEYDLERLTVRIEFTDPIDLANYDFAVTPLGEDIEPNYDVIWEQWDDASVDFEVSKNSITSEYEELNEQLSNFVEVRFNSSLLSTSVDLSSVQILESSYKEGILVQDFIELECDDRLVKEYLATPEITSFEPTEVCAGIKADLSSGIPSIPGYVIIKGNNFGNVDPANFPVEIPNNYRVEFIREQQLNTTSFKVTPMPEDYVYWTDTEIKVRIPTAGWLVNNNSIISGPEPSNAVTGRIRVRNPDGSDNTGDDKLVIRFANFNTLDPANNNHSFPRKLINRSGNGGYYLIFDSSFDNIYPSNVAAAKQDVIDAICEWNMITSAKLEIITTCPTGATCFKITYEDFNTTGGATVALAAGLSQPSPFSCPNEVVISFMELRYNSEITDWKPSSEANPLIDDHIIKTSAYHEIGHLFQLGHVYNDDALMHPFYDSGSDIDTDASAGGTHVSNVSAATTCTNPLVQGIIASCMTPTFEIQEDGWIMLSPNPATDWLHLNFEKDFNKFKVRIYDALGHLKTNQMIISSSHQIDISSFPPGTYLLILEDGTFSKSIKFTKI